MADFCRQCTEQDGMPGGDYSAGNGDLQHIITDAEWLAGLCSNGICEGCAGGAFDPDGYCLGGCLNEIHHTPRNQPDA